MLEPPQGVGHYQFTHVLVQEAIASKLSATRRARLHREIGEVLEKLYVNALESHAAELAHHFAQADPGVAADKFVGYSLMAGEQALAAYAYEDALGHFQRGLAAKEGQPVDAETAALLAGLGRAQASTLSSHQADEAVSGIARAFDYYAKARDFVRAVSLVEDSPVPPLIGHSTGAAQLIARALALVPSDSLGTGPAIQGSSYPESGETTGRVARLI